MKSYNYYLRKKVENEKRESQNKVYFYAEATGSDFSSRSDTTNPAYGDIDINENINDRYEAFRRQQEHQFAIFTYKDSKYGRGNIFGDDETTYTDEQTLDALHGLYFRMRDKLNRYKTLIENEALGQDNQETIFDTLDDLANYANIAYMVKTKKW